MEFIVKLLIFCVAQFSIANCQYISLVGSHLAPDGSDYKLYLTGQNLTSDAQVNVTLAAGTEFTHSQVLMNFDGNLHQEVNFKLPFHHEHKMPYHVTIEQSTKSSRICMKQSVTINNNYKHHKIFINMDKAAYKNGDEIKFQVFLLDQRFLPYNFQDINIVVMDGNGNIVRKFNRIFPNKHGLVQRSLKIADEPNVGTWKLQVDVDGKRRSKEFEVQHQDEDSHEINIEAPKAVAFASRYISFDVSVKHPTDKTFIGTAKIKVSARFMDNSRSPSRSYETVAKLPSLKNNFLLSIEDDLDIRFPSADMIITIAVEAIEERTLRSQSSTVEFPMRHKGSHNILLDRKPYFLPGFTYPMTVKVMKLNGYPDNSFKTLEMTVTYRNFNKDTNTFVNDVKNFDVALKNGEVLAPLHPLINTRKITLDFNFDKTELREVIEPLSGFANDEFMEIKVSDMKDKTVGDTIEIKAQSTADLETLQVFVVGQYGIVYSKDYPEARDIDFFKFNLMLTEEMRPGAHVVVFYVRRKDGAIIFDEFPLHLGLKIDNSLEISANSVAEPSKIMKFNIKSEKGAKVFLTATDINPESYTRNNEITRNDVMNEIFRFMSLKIHNNFPEHIEMSNTFLLQPMTDGVPCSMNVDEGDEVTVADDETPSIAQKLSMRYFPDVWFHEALEMSNDGVQTLEMQAPSRLTTWKVHGVSVHPTKGFAVAKQELNILVTSDLALKVYTPISMEIGEVLKVEYGVHNFLKDPRNSNIEISIQNGDLMTEKRRKLLWKECIYYEHQNQSVMSEQLYLPEDSISEVHSVFVKPTETGRMSIKFTVTADKSRDEVERVIGVYVRKTLKEKSAGTYLIDIKTNESFEKHVNLELAPGEELANVYVTLSTDLLGPVLRDLDRMSDLPLDYDLHKMYKFDASLIVADYLWYTTDKVKPRVIDAILKGYQEALAIVQRQRDHEREPLSTNLLAYTTHNLINAKNFINVDDDVVDGLLRLLESQQNADGSFLDLTDTTIEFGSRNPRILTAKVFAAFYADPTKWTKYENVISKCLSYMNGTINLFPSDLERAIYANVLDRSTSKMLLASMTNEYMKPTANRREMAMFIEIASYTILAKLRNNEDPTTQVEWLLNQRNPEGSFYSSHDSVLALRALKEYSIWKHSDKTDFRLIVDGQDVDRFNPQLATKPQHDIKVTGNGLGYLTVYYDYYQSRSDMPHDDFITDVKTKDLGKNMVEVQVDVKLVAKDIMRSNLVVVEVQLPSGYQYNEHDDAAYIQKVKLSNSRNVVSIYMSAVDAKKVYRHTIRAVKVHEIEYPGKSVIIVYDYNRPNVRDQVQYGLAINPKLCPKDDNNDSKNGEVRTAGRPHFNPEVQPGVRPAFGSDKIIFESSEEGPQVRPSGRPGRRHHTTPKERVVRR